MVRVMKRVFAVGFVFAALSAGFYAYTVRTAASEPNVVTQPLSLGTIVDAVTATGTLEAVETVEVGTQVSGVVDDLFADFNSIVKKGQVIAKLDPLLIRTQIEQQEANLERAKADVDRVTVSLADARQKLERARQLAERNLIPRTELETADVNVRAAEAQIRSSEAALTQARAQLNNTRVNLSYTTIKAPIDGIVISRNVDAGQTVAASMNAPTLFVIAADLTRMRVIANIDESDVGRMRPGQRVTFRVDAFPSDVFTGIVAQVRLQPTVVQNVVTYSTVISVPNEQLKLKPGMTANVTIEIARRDGVLRVPLAVTRFRPTSEMFAALNQPLPPEFAAAAGSAAPRAAGEQAVRASRVSSRPDPAPIAPRAGTPAAGGAARRPVTADSLFAPIEVRETRATAWVFENNQLKLVRLRLGTTDGSFGEVLNPDDIKPGTNVVMSMTTGLEARNATQTRQSNPLMGSQPGRGGFGGGRGGG
jgi:HlyD family secretion protein